MIGAALSSAGCLDDEPEPAVSDVELDLQNPPSNAVFVPADYDGDGLTDFAVKGSNGVWYIDVASCARPVAPETDCSNFVDDDLDGLVNDGCPARGREAETFWNGCTAPYSTTFDDDDHPPILPLDPPLEDYGDSYIDDGCPTNSQCLGPEGRGGRWDFAYAGYGDATAIPIPADYGTLNNGPADGKADLAVKDANGMFAIDFADNGFGSFDAIYWGYGNAGAVPWVGDFDGDERADLSVRTTDGSGYWYFDYSSDGFGGWDIPCTTGCPCNVQPGPGYAISGYGNGLATPAIGDFNGDSCADLSVKDQDYWYFDFHGDGFGWQAPCPTCPWRLGGYGNTNYRPIVADYDNDERADLSVLTPDGYWAIDFAADGFGAWNTWPFYNTGQGSGVTAMAPGRYLAGNGNLDQAFKTSMGDGFIDHAANGYGGHDERVSTSPSLLDTRYPYIDGMYISKPTVPAVLPENGGNFTETEVLLAPGAVEYDLKIGVRYTANIHVEPGTICTAGGDDDFDGRVNDGCPAKGDAEGATLCDDTFDNDGDGIINDGCPNYPDPIHSLGEFVDATVRINPDLRVPASLNVQNVGGHTVQNSAGFNYYPHYRRISFTCSEYGSFPLGFITSPIHSSTLLNGDYGVRVKCSAQFAGAYGWVKDKRTGAVQSGVDVIIGGQVRATTNAQGFWIINTLTGGPHRLLFSKTGYAPTEAINVRVPSSGLPVAGVQVDVALEQSFSLQNGITFKTYIDYSRGRTLLHTVEVDVTRAPISLGKVPQVSLVEPHPETDDFQRLDAFAQTRGAPVIVNGMWWTLSTPNKNRVGRFGLADCEDAVGPTFENTRPIGYLYMNGYVGPNVCAEGACRPSELECASGKWLAQPAVGRAPGPSDLIQNAWRMPMFGVRGSGSQRRAEIIMTDYEFMLSTNGWRRATGVPNCPAGNACPIFDANGDSQSDYQFAFQMGHVLLFNNKVIARGVIAKLGTTFPGEFSFARTTVGTNSTGTRAWFVVADGEGIDGGNGATPNQIGEFYRDILGADDAMIIDSGESTEMILRRSTGVHRTVNILSSENHACDSISPDGDFMPRGRVYGFIQVGN